MYCSKCGKENPDEAVFCNACGNRLVTQAPIDQEISGTLSPSTPELKKMNVLLLIFLTVITLGIYIPIWFLKRRKAINTLQSKKKLGSTVFIFNIALQSINLLYFLISLTGELPEMSREVERVIDALIAIPLLVQSFKVRRIFHDHFSLYFKGGPRLSGLATWFLQIFYLQHKINKFGWVLRPNPPISQSA